MAAFIQVDIVIMYYNWDGVQDDDLWLMSLLAEVFFDQLVMECVFVFFQVCLCYVQGML
jgi:hypothetical protein